MRHGPPIFPSLLCVAAILAHAGCGSFREFPRLDGSTDRLDAVDVADRVVPDVTAMDVPLPDVTVAPDRPIADDTVDAGPCGGPCPAGRACCDNRCVDLATDIVNCGSCSVTCTAPNASSTCQMGRCVPLCRPGFGDCDGNALNGCEVDLSVSVFNCGACRTECGNSHATATCDTGRCRIACDAAWGDCDGNAANGCEVNIRSALSHCGSCDSPCPVANHNSVDCLNGLCQFGACERGYDNCNRIDRDGCEINVNDDVNNCGRCGNVCPTPAGRSATCIVGVCGTAVACSPATLGDCDGVSGNGCETDLTRAVSDCNRCGNACSFNHATPTCTPTGCALACAAGYNDCDVLAANGCEVETRASVMNCGRCGNACSLTRTAVHACSNGACVPAACVSGFGNCDGMPANGCEADLSTTIAHCGGCNQPCVTPRGVAACVAGRCAIARCDPGFADCNGNAADGCEVEIASNINHCGRCGMRCSPVFASPACVAGACRVASCLAPWLDCNNDPADGCEVFPFDNPMHCGRCGVTCPAPLRCRSGACAP